MKPIYLLAMCLSLGACERVVALDLPEGPKQLVVEARIERVRGAVTGEQRFRLTTTDNYFSNNAPPPARGATVRVGDDAGTIVTFMESLTEPGVYTTSLMTGVLGRRYTLQIDWQGDRYEATEALEPVPAIDTLYFQDRTSTFGPKLGKRATIDFRDPGGKKNYYVWDQYVNGVRQVVPDSTFRVRVIAPDDGLDGRRIRRFQPYDGIPVASGSQVLVRQMALSESMYRYYFALSDQASNDGSPFSVPLSSVRSNIANRTRSDRRPLGYFMATEVAEARAAVP